MSETVRISGSPPAPASLNYSVLRESGMEYIRLWAKQSWTDHNVHDPGVTLLEAASYAMTELGLRLQLDVSDLLRSGEARWRPELEPAQRVLPVGPVHAEDLRSVLLDHPLVSDAQIFLPAANEVPFFEAAAAADPPLTYTSGTPRVRPGGLYEVLIELAERELNSNTYPFQVTSNGQSYDVEVALPYWDEAEAAPFREPAAVNTVTMVVDAGEVWRALPETQSYYGKLDVAYTDPTGTPVTIAIWVVLRITAPLAQPGSVVPGILVAVRAAIESTAAGAPLLLFAARVQSAAAAVAQLADYLSSWRNLGEQAVRIGLARVQEVAVHARLEVTGGIDVERLFARIFMAIDSMLSPLVRLESLEERRGREADPERIYDGPLLRRGFLDRSSASARRLTVVYTSDVLRLIMRRRNAEGIDVVIQESPVGRDIVAVTDLTLGNFINNRPITSDAEDCLHLVEIERYRPRLSLTKSRLVAVRNDSEVRYDLARVRNLFEALQAEARDGSVTDDSASVWPVQPGDLLPLEDYTPLQNELPALYGVGNAELPDSAGLERHSATKQLRGYLMLFEQFLGDLTAQLGNINRFYSGDGSDESTYFPRVPFDLPGAEKLLHRFPTSGDWAAFVADPANPVARALHDAAETRERRLDRRNRMLDHLLARQGEDVIALGQETHRRALAELAAASLPPAQQEARIADRREAANARLLANKSALLRETPELNAFRLLASGNPFFRDAALLTIEPAATGFRWTLAANGEDWLRAVDPVPGSAAAAIAAERALAFAGRSTNYSVVNIGGQTRVRLMDGPGVAAQVLGESPQSFASVAEANAALAASASAFATARVESSLCPIERRIAHHSGIREARRRRSFTATNLYFEIYDDSVTPGLVGRRWRLHELPGNAGPLLLASAVRFDAPTASQAVELAEGSIRQVLRYGLDEWNYTIVPAAGTFGIELRDPAGNPLALGPTALATVELAREALATTVAHLYRTYAAEGLYLLEHLLLRPRRAGDSFLSLPVSETERERDPYSHRISLVFPSGLARDFSLPRVGAPISEVTPDRFRDPAFRRHVEGVVQRACPAHLLPKLYWVDSELTGSAPSVASFDSFEGRYFAWLDTLLIPGATPVTVDAARNGLVEALNAIANDAA